MRVLLVSLVLLACPAPAQAMMHISQREAERHAEAFVKAETTHPDSRVKWCHRHGRGFLCRLHVVFHGGGVEVPVDLDWRVWRNSRGIQMR